ncbi:hypothetical protein HK097_000197 [Rhizophlyctis rosea]|uniref:Uncharacterized protein n=1 Tax=Rhizophlyctis rosea TaxID=64517 RepID=A0AAD5SI89_9FUNG|nr:hypothetical protein HK097_000197 [Rhizophlyctis rosea]
MSRLHTIHSRLQAPPNLRPPLPRNSHPFRIFHRKFTEYESEPRTRSRLLHPVALALYTVPLIGIAAWYWYTANPYPEEARQALRKALMSHNHEREGKRKAEDAEVEYIKAIDESIKGGLPEHGPEVTGIILRLAELYEKLNRHDEALATFYRVFVNYEGTEFQGATSTALLQDSMRMRQIVGLSQRIGDVYRSKGDMRMAEDFYEWSTKTIMGFYEPPPRMKSWTMPHAISSQTTQMTDWVAPPDPAPAEVTRQKQAPAPSTPPPTPTKPQPQPPQELTPAPWATPRDLGASLESLAGLYRETKRTSLAIPLYFRAVQLVSQDTSRDMQEPERLCRTAILNNNIAECITSLGGEQQQHAKHWALAALERAEASNHKGGGGCEECLSVVLHNLGMMAEVIIKAR